ncbi:ATM_1a_G0051030.mRNA.1.CDS.1 [Saccharomyces cerevisiae]|nr:ATM_1a_G0051030.mRNA.1.CDS.1 [Saccharomyces cerevisiae]CAI7349301.1 ATM_1a_G0051030.mRNA.1.CDS.1 [Saccharomyces cerevisiae]
MALLKKYLHSQLREAYLESKRHFISKKGDSTNTSSTIASSSFAGASVPLSSNESGMLNGLKQINEQQESTLETTQKED